MKIYTEQEIINAGYSISNDIIENIDVNIIGHFGNVVSLELFCKTRRLLSGYNNTRNIGQMAKFLIEFLEIDEEEGIRLSEIKNVPIRIVTEVNNYGICIGFGHYMENKFILTEDFVKIGAEDNTIKKEQ